MAVHDTEACDTDSDDPELAQLRLWTKRVADRFIPAIQIFSTRKQRWIRVRGMKQQLEQHRAALSFVRHGEGPCSVHARSASGP